MAYKLTADHLTHLATINSFPIPDAELVFFGIRGCLPVDPFDHDFASSQTLGDYASPNYLNPRCTIGQWRLGAGELALYPASTVPFSGYVQKALAKKGVGVNEMLTGFYGDYRKGTHKADSGSGHAAFRQTADRAYRRTADDLDFDPYDRVEVGNPFDNLHAAYGSSLSGQYSSAGCQVVVGQPQRKDGLTKESGPWKIFRKTAYAVEQNAFGYMLLDGWEVQRQASIPAKTPTPARLRFGSKGDLVTRVQDRLKATGAYEGNLDTEFGPRTLKAVLRFQEHVFGPGGDDGIVGPATAEALEISDWPSL